MAVNDVIKPLDWLKRLAVMSIVTVYFALFSATPAIGVICY